MFTGLIQATGEVLAAGEVGGAGDGGGPGAPARGSARRIRVITGWDHRPVSGESITINGCCLTLAAAPEPAPGARSGQILAFDAIPETLSRTTLGLLQPGDRVNLERSLRAEDLLGGHLVQGHVDGVGEVLEAGEVGADGGGGGGWRVRIGASPEVMEMVTPKGSITISGVSLTVATCTRESFEVALIPETLARTNLSDLVPGARVNLETDILARTMIHWLKNWAK